MTPPPRARELQGGANGRDAELTRHARLRRPKVRHWWGVRIWYVRRDYLDMGVEVICRVDDPDREYRTGAWCYLCDRPIARWSGRWPVTEQAKAAIALHRTEHVQGRLLVTHTGDETT